MSRNFELLQKLGKERDMFYGAGKAAIARDSQTAPADLQPLQLEMEERQRDEITRMVQNIFLAPGPDAPRVVVFSGLESGTGCSWVVARAADILASQVNGSVCVLDANLRAPGLHTQFGVENLSGLAEVLAGPELLRRSAIAVGRPNLWFLAAGQSDQSINALVGVDRFRARLTELREDFDHILIDAPALNSGTDTTVLGQVADGVVVVLKANASRRETARKSIQDLQSANVRVLGAVLNQRTFPIPESIYRRF
jgi:Mrp family chromosome partitioning ATPase